jgi:hypothetical protein
LNAAAAALPRERFRSYGAQGEAMAPSSLQTADNRWSALWHR